MEDGILFDYDTFRNCISNTDSEIWMEDEKKTDFQFVFRRIEGPDKSIESFRWLWFLKYFDIKK